MSSPSSPAPTGADVSPEERQAALFAQLVAQQTNLTLMLLGKVPNPQTGQTTRDLESARLFIDQLEMLEAKTRGNLTREETQLLQQSLMTLRLAFVEAVEAPEPAPANAPAGSPAPTPSATGKGAPAETPGGPGEEEPRKRFTKKY